MKAELSRIRVTENNEKLFEDYGCDDLYHVIRIHCDCLCDSKYDVIKPYADYVTKFDNTFNLISPTMIDSLWGAIKDMRDDCNDGYYSDETISTVIEKLYGGFSLNVRIIKKL